jgi:hypothetical protein
MSEENKVALTLEELKELPRKRVIEVLSDPRLSSSINNKDKSGRTLFYILCKIGFFLFFFMFLCFVYVFFCLCFFFVYVLYFVF